LVNNITALDDKIVLYYENKETDYVSLIENLCNKTINRNVWELSSNKNNQDTDLTLNNKIFYLPNFDNLFDWWRKSNNNIFDNGGKEKGKLRNLLNENILPFIVDYMHRFELEITEIKKWSICENLNSDNFYSDMSRNEIQNNYTVIVFLNDNYVGGEVQFENRVGNDTTKITKGGVLIYPSTEEYKHKHLPVTSGTKYVAVTYF
jgi:hypothetical protein